MEGTHGLPRMLRASLLNVDEYVGTLTIYAIFQLFKIILISRHCAIICYYSPDTFHHKAFLKINPDLEFKHIQTMCADSPYMAHTMRTLCERSPRW